MARNAGHLSLLIGMRFSPLALQFCNMAARKRCLLEVDYAQLNALSSVVLYDTKKSKKRSKNNRIYDVERIIERRNVKHVSFSLQIFFDYPCEIINMKIFAIINIYIKYNLLSTVL
jgi:hypothetical protein